MARFEFKLEALLTARLQAEREKQRRVGAINQEIQRVVQHIQETQAQILSEDHALGAKELTGRLDMQYIANEKRFVGNLRVRVILAMQQVTQLEQSLAKARAELLEAARARKVIEKLREKQFARWREEQDRKESAVMDEIGMQLTIRGAI